LCDPDEKKELGGIRLVGREDKKEVEEGRCTYSKRSSSYTTVCVAQACFNSMPEVVALMTSTGKH